MDIRITRGVMYQIWLNLKAVTRWYSGKNVFLKVSQNLQENTVPESVCFFCRPITVLKRDSGTGVFL